MNYKSASKSVSSRIRSLVKVVVTTSSTTLSICKHRARHTAHVSTARHHQALSSSLATFMCSLPGNALYSV